MEADSSVLSEIVKAKENIKRKYNALKSIDTDVRQLMSQTFKPIIDPLTKISNQNTSKIDAINNKTETKISNEVSLDQHVEENSAFNIKDEEYQNRINQWFNSVDLDKTYGPKIRADRTITLGKKEVKFIQNSILIDGEEYTITPGIIRLLFNKNPMVYTQDDLETYRKILIQTSAHLNRDDKIKTTGNKYMKIISDLFNTGLGLNNYDTSMNLQEHNLVYWDDPNELVDRLRLLLASKAAGNTGVSNEILSIFEELLEAGLIKRIPHV